MTMESFTEILEDELAHSFEVKDKSALHRSVLLLAEHVVSREKHAAEFQLLRSDIADTKSEVKVVAEAMKKGFESMDKRFEDIDKRFGDVNKRFSMMTSFMSIGFITLGVLVTLYQFLG